MGITKRYSYPIFLVVSALFVELFLTGGFVQAESHGDSHQSNSEHDSSMHSKVESQSHARVMFDPETDMGEPVKPSDLVDVPCAVLDGFSEQTHILNVDRTKTIDLKLQAPVVCGSWISTKQGFASVKYLDGQNIHLGPNTIIQIKKISESEDPFRSPHAIKLFHGSVYVNARGGSKELSVETPTALAAVTRGRIIVSFKEEDDLTKLVSLQGKATLENRFESSKKAEVSAGEMTELDLSLLRVVPVPPKPVALASLTPLLEQMNIDSRQQVIDKRVALGRRERKLATSFEEKNEYRRSVPDDDDEKLKEHLVRRLAGTKDIGRKILYPDRYYGRARKVRVQVEEVESQIRREYRQKDRSEKARIMEELSHIEIE